MSISVQKQIKDNATEVSTYFSDLYNWTEEQGKREQRRQGRPTVDLAAAAASAAGGVPATSSTATAKAEERKLALNRDGTAMPKYYHDWDQVDVDKMADDIDEEARRQQQAERASRQAQKDSILDDLALKGDGDRSRTSKAKPRVKIAVRASGRRVAPVDLAAPKKEEANRYLAEGRYREAVATYTAALELLEKYEPACDGVAQEAAAGEDVEARAGDCAGENTEALLLKTALLANRSLALMKLEEWRDTAADCTEALRFDPQHHKATLRRGFAHARLKLWARAVPDLRRAVAGDPADRRAAAELQMACRMLEEQSVESRAHAKRAMCDPTRNLTMPVRKLAVRVQRPAATDGVSAGSPEAEPPVPGATAAATAQVLRAAAAEVDGDDAAGAQPAAKPADAVPAPRQPYVPRAVRMRGRQAGQSAAMQAALAGGGAAASSQAGPGSGAAAPGPSGPPAMNFYTFEAQWNRHRSRPAERVALLRRVGASALPVFFRESLDPELLAAIVEALASETAAGAPDALSLAPHVLEALARTPRFEMSLHCLSGEERQTCSSLVDRLGATGACDAARLERVRAAFAPPVGRRPAPADDSDDAAEAVPAGGAAPAPPALGFSLDGCD